MTVAGMLEGAECVRKQLEGIRTEAKFIGIIAKTNERARELGLDPLSLPRSRKVPRKHVYNDCSASSQHAPVSVEDHYRPDYFKIIDSALV